MQYFESNKEFLKKSNNYIGNVELIDFKFEGFNFSGDTFEYEPSNLSAGGHTYEKQFYFEIIGNIWMYYKISDSSFSVQSDLWEDDSWSINVNGSIKLHMNDMKCIFEGESGFDVCGEVSFNSTQNSLRLFSKEKYGLNPFTMDGNRTRLHIAGDDLIYMYMNRSEVIEVDTGGDVPLHIARIFENAQLSVGEEEITLGLMYEDNLIEDYINNSEECKRERITGLSDLEICSFWTYKKYHKEFKIDFSKIYKVLMS